MNLDIFGEKLRFKLLGGSVRPDLGVTWLMLLLTTTYWVDCIQGTQSDEIDN